MLRRHFRFLLPVAAILIFGLIWEVGVRAMDVPSFLLPAPSRIWHDTMTVPGWAFENLLATSKTILLGFALSVLIGFPLAILIASSEWCSDVLLPLLLFTQSVPKVAVAPILVVALGANELPRVSVTFLVAFFPLVISTSTGLLATPPAYRELAKSNLASSTRELLLIRIPFAVPHIFSGLKVAISLAVVGAVVGEFVVADRGLGYMITASMAYFHTPVAFGAMILLSLLGIFLFQAVGMVERIFFPWSARAGRNQE